MPHSIGPLLLLALLAPSPATAPGPPSGTSRAGSQSEALAGGLEILVDGGGVTVNPVDPASGDFVTPAPTAPAGVPAEPADAPDEVAGPGDEERPANVCGPDVTEAYVVALQRAHERLSALGDEERGAWDGMHFLRRNGANIDVVARAVVEEGVEGGGQVCPRGACERTVTLAGHCVTAHIANDIMYGFVVEMLGVPWAIALGGGHAWDLLQYGGLDPNTSKAAYTAGAGMASWMNQGRPLSAPAFERIFETTTIVEGGFFGAETITLIDLVRRDESQVLRCDPCPADCTSDLTKDFSRMNWSLSDGKSAPYEDPTPPAVPDPEPAPPAPDAEPAPPPQAGDVPSDDGKECGTAAYRFGLCDPGSRTADADGEQIRTVDAAAVPAALGGPSGAGGADAAVEIVIEGRGVASGDEVFDVYVVPGRAPVAEPVRIVLPPGMKLVPVENPDARTLDRAREIRARADGRGNGAFRIPATGAELPTTRNLSWLHPRATGRAGGAVRASLPAYCLDRERTAPGEGMLYRIAPSADEQEETAVWVTTLLAASLELRAAGTLRPDSDPHEYFHSIRQWAIWVYAERMNAHAFEAALLEHTRRNVEAAGQPWTERMAEVVRGIVPNRWEDVRRIIERAEAY